MPPDASRGRGEKVVQSSNPATVPTPNRNRRTEFVEAAFDNATPFFKLTGAVLELVPVPGLPLIAKVLTIIMNRVQVSWCFPLGSISSSHYSTLFLQYARANDDVLRSFNEELMKLDAVIKEMLTQTQKAVKNYDGDDSDKDKLLDDIAHSEELHKRTEALSKYVSNSLDNL